MTLFVFCSSNVNHIKRFLAKSSNFRGQSLSSLSVILPRLLEFHGNRIFPALQQQQQRNFQTALGGPLQQQLVWFDEKTVPAGWKIPSLTIDARNNLRKMAKKENVTFIREDGESETKTLFWCLEHGYYELQKGVWSGLWYWDKLKERGIKKKHHPLPPDVQLRMAAGKNDWYHSGLLRDVSSETITKILKIKQHADEHFVSLNYEDAAWFYNTAIQEFPQKLVVMRTEHMDLAISILNLQAECYLKMEKWYKAEQTAAFALDFDLYHEESRFQRGVAAFSWLMKENIMNYPLPAATCDEDLWFVLNLKNGKRRKEAKKLYDEFHDKVDIDKEEHFKDVNV